MMSGILIFCRYHKKIQRNIIVRKMLSLVKEYDEYHKNIDNIKFLMLTYNDLNHGFMIDMFEYMRVGT